MLLGTVVVLFFFLVFLRFFFSLYYYLFCHSWFVHIACLSLSHTHKRTHAHVINAAASRSSTTSSTTNQLISNLSQQNLCSMKKKYIRTLRRCQLPYEMSSWIKVIGFSFLETQFWFILSSSILDSFLFFFCYSSVYGVSFVDSIILRKCELAKSIRSINWIYHSWEVTTIYQWSKVDTDSTEEKEKFLLFHWWQHGISEYVRKFRHICVVSPKNAPNLVRAWEEFHHSFYLWKWIIEKSNGEDRIKPYVWFVPELAGHLKFQFTWHWRPQTTHTHEHAMQTALDAWKFELLLLYVCVSSLVYMNRLYWK